MGLSPSLLAFMRFFLSVSLFYLIFAGFFSSVQSLCHDDESFALLKFKESFTINKSASDDSSAYPKVLLWKHESGDCCRWRGVKCNEDTGHVISLDLSSSCLYGSFNSNSNLFQLVHLQSLNLAHNHFNFSRIPTTFRQLSRLTNLNLSRSAFSGLITSEILELSNLVSLDLSFNYRLKLQKHGLRSIAQKLTNLKELHLSEVDISSTVPNILANLSSLTSLFLEECGLHGEFPTRIFHLPNLSSLLVGDNPYLIGSMPDFNRSSPLESLRLRYTSFSGELPNSIGNLESLKYFAVTFCNFSGSIPSAFVFLPWTNLGILALRSNLLRGPLPIPPPSIVGYAVSNNKLTGEIPQLICNLSSIVFLDGSNNYLSGLLPQCLGNLSDSLSVLNLHDNGFHGTIPETFAEGNKLKMIHFSQNQLQGRLPRSLANCTMLEALNLGHNQMNDTFPFWLGILPKLRVLILRSNGIYGAMENLNSNFDFSNVHIIDVSNNDITGKLPSQYFQNWKAMQIHDVKGFMYMKANGSFSIPGTRWDISFVYSMTFTYKGTERVYKKISDVFVAIDLSNNRFEGEISEVVGYLKGLQVLNLSNNFLTGPIPSSLVNLTNLEVLDFAQNKLSGVIPLQLVQLTFIAFFNVSHNHLTGPIPHGNQFETFSDSSFSGNSELCGRPLSKKCENSEDSPPPPPTSEKNQNSSFLFEFSWKVVVMGYGCGIIFGLIVGQIVFTKKHDLVMKTFAIKQPTRKRVNRRRYRN
ncbi:receptor-like protein 43 [Alnus glutinosa]|uniref:receptor-like protein 43 n=1 Tax=Alnus glutinosa TaxID=3517 RepID=UPI002D78EE39|nr:receptor-like protein 43 [Alnus glutinosa]